MSVDLIKNNMPTRRVEDLRIWIEARLFVKEIYILMRENRDFGFKDQIQRASVSIMNNIAEGFDSGSDAKFINFLNIAKGSCSEVKSMLYLCEDLEYCSIKERERLHAQLFNISSGIYKFIEYLKKRAVSSLQSRDNSQETTVNCITPDGKSIVGRLLSVVRRSLTVVRCPLSVVGVAPSVDRCPLSVDRL